jgi:ribosomal protein S18 acetylase RimI-like enzyme
MRQLARQRAFQNPDQQSVDSQVLDQLLGVLPFLAVLFAAWFLYQIANPVFDRVPRGLMPSLTEWLVENSPPPPAGSYGGRAPPARKASRLANTEISTSGVEVDGLEELTLEPVRSVPELWEAYRFSTLEIVEEVPSMIFQKNFVMSVVLQVASFPEVYSNWEKYESCAVEEIALGPSSTALGPIPSNNFVQPISEVQPEREVVLQCGQMVKDYGLSLLARDGSGDIAGSLTLHVKRLPEACHVDYDQEGDASVVCTVDTSAVYDAASLEAVAYLDTIAVSRAWRGSGLALKLLNFVEEKARAWGLNILALHVHRDNWSGLHFYRKHGFEVTSDWLGWGENFFLLIKPLQAEADQWL